MLNFKTVRLEMVKIFIVFKTEVLYLLVLSFASCQGSSNGSEFSNPKEIEKRSTIPCNRTKIFYCDPSAPYQKGACEVNHELIRRILPKGSSFDELTQQDITLMMNHINSYKRKKLNNRSPYETFSFYYGEDVLKRLGCSPVAAENIILKPKLLKK